MYRGLRQCPVHRGPYVQARCSPRLACPPQLATCVVTAHICLCPFPVQEWDSDLLSFEWPSNPTEFSEPSCQLGAGAAAEGNSSAQRRQRHAHDSCAHTRLRGHPPARASSDPCFLAAPAPCSRCWQHCAPCR